MVSGPVDPAWIEQTARENGFSQVEFERAYRLAHLLSEINQHPWLCDRLVLKGGTAINFVHTDLARLSVDMDLNYVGSPDLDAMREERDRVTEELTRLGEAHGYTFDPHTDAHALWGARFVYENAYGSGDSIKADVNFIERVPLFGTEQHPLPELFDLPGIPVRCLTVEELYGGKLSALVQRAVPRDLYDAWHFFQEGIPHDSDRLRKAFLFHAHMSDATLETVDLTAPKALSEQDYREELDPMLQDTDRPDPEEMVATVLPRLEAMLELTGDEQAFGQRLEAQVYEPSLLFGDVEVSPDIETHPAAEWRRRHPHAQLRAGEADT